LIRLASIGNLVSDYRSPASSVVCAVCVRVCLCVFVTALSGIHHSGPSWFQGNHLLVITADNTGHALFVIGDTHLLTTTGRVFWLSDPGVEPPTYSDYLFHISSSKLCTVLTF